MPVNIGPKIGIDGEKEFRQNLNSISQQLKTLGTEMKAVTSAFDANDKSQENLANQSQVLTEQLSLQEKRIAEIQKALDHARSNYAENSNQVQRWQQAMNNAVAELNKTRSQLSKVQSEMDGTEDSTKDLTDALNDVGGASEKASGGLSSMTVAMGNLISSGIQAAASAVADLVSSLWNLDESTEEYRRAQGRLNTAFEAAGYGADTAQQAYQAFYGILGDTDTATEASQLLAQLAESEEDVATWTEIAAGVSGTFGDSLPIEGLIEAANETAKVGQVTGTLADALNWVGINEEQFNAQLAECSTESERNKLIMETLSNQYDQAAQAFYRNNEALVASRNAQAQMDAVTAQLGNTIANVKNQLTANLLPALSGLADAFNGILTGAPGATEAFSQAIQGLIAAVVDMLPQFLDTGLQIISSVVNGIVQALPELAQAGVEIIGQIVATITENLPQVLDMGLQLLDQLTSGIESGLPDMVSRIPQIITEFLDYLTGELPTILEKGVEILNNLVDGIIESIPDMVAALPEVITAFTQFIAENFPKIIKSGGEIIGNLIMGILGAIPEILINLPSVISAMLDALSEGHKQFQNIGAYLLEGLWEGISNKISWLVEKLKNAVSTVIDAAEDFLGINSPSKVFAGMGENMALGLGEGFAGEMRGVQRQIDRSMAGLVAPSMTYGVTAATSAPVYSGGDTIGASVGAAVRAALDGAAVYLNGRKVGNLITQQQNQTTIARGQSPAYI
mgnify:FL=1